MNLHVRAARPAPKATCSRRFAASCARSIRGCRCCRRRRCRRSTIESLALWAVRAGGRTVPRLRAARAAPGRRRPLRRQVVRRVAAHARDRDPHGARRAVVRRAAMVLKEGAVAGGGRRRASGCCWPRCSGRLLSGMLYDVKPLDPVVFVTAPSCWWSPRSWRRGFPPAAPRA